MPWMKNSDGKPDAVLTFTAYTFGVVLFKLFFAGLSVTAGPVAFTVQALDASMVGAILTPTLGAYVANKYTRLNYHPDFRREEKPEEKKS